MRKRARCRRKRKGPQMNMVRIHAVGCQMIKSVLNMLPNSSSCLAYEAFALPMPM